MEVENRSHDVEVAGSGVFTMPLLVSAIAKVGSMLKISMGKLRDVLKFSPRYLLPCKWSKELNSG